SEVLAEVLEMKKSKVAVKAKSLKERLDKAIQKGQELELRHGGKPQATAKAEAASDNAEKVEKAEAPQDSDTSQLLAMVQARRGDICCFMIYNHPGQHDARVESLLVKAPAFQMRHAIAREEAF